MVTVLVVTGAAGAGKSTVCRALQGEPGLVVIDGDTVASGATAVADGRHDYEAYWRFVLRLSVDLAANGLTPVICGIGLPGQVVPAAEEEGVVARMLVLGTSEAAIRSRTTARPGDDAHLDIARHVAVDRTLRVATVPPPHRLDFVDTVGRTPEETIAAARAWAAAG